MSSSNIRPGEGVFAHWPNRITAIRFVGSLFLFVLFSIYGETAANLTWPHIVAFWLFVVLGTSDYLDGYLARRGNLVTAFGRIADPFVDKVLVLGSMIFLAVMEWSRPWFPAWIVVVVLAREFLVTGVRGYVESLGLEFPADWFGKIKMIVQCLAVGCVLSLYGVHWPDPVHRFWEIAGHVLVWATLITSVGSGVSYVFKTKKLLAGSTT